MAARDVFLAHVLELLGGLGAVRARRMFGGYGLYRDDVMFALIADDTLYFKVDERNRAEFEARGMQPFHYSRKDRAAVTMSYFQAPPEALDNDEDMLAWARSACDAALRQSTAKAARKPSVPRRGSRKKKV